MAYGDTAGVLARAGVLAAAFAPGQPVDESSIEQFLFETAATLDVGLGAHGVGVPVTDATAIAALASINEDMALLLAIDGAWPGSSSRNDVKDLRDTVQARVTEYLTSLKDGEVALLFYLGTASGGGSSDFWTSDSMTYQWWEYFVGTRRGLFADPWGAASGAQPTITKDMAL